MTLGAGDVQTPQGALDRVLRARFRVTVVPPQSGTTGPAGTQARVALSSPVTHHRAHDGQAPLVTVQTRNVRPSGKVMDIVAA